MRGDCDAGTSMTVRNSIIEEDNAPFGFDIVKNTPLFSPFQLNKDGCGTNI